MDPAANKIRAQEVEGIEPLLDHDAIPARCDSLSFAHQAQADPLCARPRLSRLDLAALALSPFRGRPAARAAAAFGPADSGLSGAGAKARPARQKSDRAVFRARLRSFGLEKRRRIDLGAAQQSLFRQSASDRGLRAARRRRGRERRGGALALCAARAWARERAPLFGRGPSCPRAASSSASRPFPGARPGNMASAPIATASSTPVMRSAAPPWPPRRSAGARASCSSLPTPRSPRSSASTAPTPGAAGRSSTPTRFCGSAPAERRRLRSISPLCWRCRANGLAQPIA